MRCGSAGTSAFSGVTPAAFGADRIGGPGSAGAGCGAHDSSGRRWLPRTPAPAMVVVLVVTELVGDGCWPPSDAGLQLEHSVTAIAVATAAAASRTPGRTRPNSTRSTVTSGRPYGPVQLGDDMAVAGHYGITTVCRTSAATGPIER
jgi:hypothetical protein